MPKIEKGEKVAKPDKPAKTKKQEKPETITEFVMKAGLNKYNFVHVPKKVVPSLPFRVGVPLKGKIEGQRLIIEAA